MHVRGLADQLGTTWPRVWSAVEPLLTAMAGDESRYDGVSKLGVDKYIWHHVIVKDGGREGAPGVAVRPRRPRGVPPDFSKKSQ